MDSLKNFKRAEEEDNDDIENKTNILPIAWKRRILWVFLHNVRTGPGYPEA